MPSMSNSFGGFIGNKFTRKWGTKQGTDVNPYISGYFFVAFSDLPSSLTAIMPKVGNGLSLSDNEIKSVLASSCLSVTMPSRTIATTDFNGLGGIRWTAPTGIDQSNDISMRFLEAKDTPIRNIFGAWTALIRNHVTGTAVEQKADPGYLKKNYTGTMYYWTTSPNGEEVQFAACATGLYPTKDPIDLFGHDVTTNDKMEVDMDFRADYVFTEKWVYDKVTNLFSTYTSSNSGDLYSEA